MKDRIDISYYALGNRNFKSLNEYPNLYKSTSSVKSNSLNLMERNYLDFEPGILNNQGSKFTNVSKAKEYSKGQDIYYKYHPEYKYYHTNNEQNQKLNDYLNPVNQYIYRESPMIKSAEQLLTIQKQKKKLDFFNANKMFKITNKETQSKKEFEKEKMANTEPNYMNLIKNNNPINKEDDIIPLKNPMNENILRSNDYHLETSTKTQRRIKPPSSTPNMEDLKYGSFLESKMSPEYLRNYDKESLKNIDEYYIRKKENLNVLSRFGNWITLKPDDKNRSHALEKLKHGTYETSIIAPMWMDIATRRKNNKMIQIENNNKGYDYLDFDRKMFDKHEYNTSIRDKGKMTILQDRDQKNAKPVYLMDSYEKNRILLEQEKKDRELKEQKI
jgi:hypothetical protein